MTVSVWAFFVFLSSLDINSIGDCFFQAKHRTACRGGKRGLCCLKLAAVPTGTWSRSMGVGQGGTGGGGGERGGGEGAAEPAGSDGGMRPRGFTPLHRLMAQLACGKRVHHTQS